MTKELETAIAAAKAAGEVARASFGRLQSVEHKGEAHLVVEADKRAEQKIKEVLGEAFPDYGILAEEGGETEGEGNARWIVDPIDGTTNYAHGVPFFVTSIALKRAGKVVLGVVHDPMRQETYAAERGNGATLNSESIRVSGTNDPAQALLGTSYPDKPEEMSVGLDLFGRFSNLGRGMRRLGSGALDLCYVAAGVLIVEEAGGEVTNYQGSKVDLEEGKQGLVASNTILHQSLVDITN